MDRIFEKKKLMDWTIFEVDAFLEELRRELIGKALRYKGINDTYEMKSVSSIEFESFADKRTTSEIVRRHLEKEKYGFVFHGGVYAFPLKKDCVFRINQIIETNFSINGHKGVYNPKTGLWTFGCVDIKEKLISHLSNAPEYDDGTKNLMRVFIGKGEFTMDEISQMFRIQHYSKDCVTETPIECPFLSNEN